MAEAATLRRAVPLETHRHVAIGTVPPMTRLSARGGQTAAQRLGRAFGVELPLVALHASVARDRAALWLGPDEWLLLAPQDEALATAVEAGLDGEPGCVVDVSHRQTGLDLTGPGAALTLSAGCPLDFDLVAFPVGMCTRTVLAKAEVVLWRRAEHRFHLECWRSFAPYCLDFLTQAARDNAG